MTGVFFSWIIADRLLTHFLFVCVERKIQGNEVFGMKKIALLLLRVNRSMAMAAGALRTVSRQDSVKIAAVPAADHVILMRQRQQVVSLKRKAVDFPVENLEQ